MRWMNPVETPQDKEAVCTSRTQSSDETGSVSGPHAAHNVSDGSYIQRRSQVFKRPQLPRQITTGSIGTILSSMVGM